MSTMHNLSGNRRTPVHVLDFVRFLAALLVVGYHLGFKAWALQDSTLGKVLRMPDAHPPGYRLSWCGWIGVQVFFVVSGAVIAYSAQGAGPVDFARRRVARLLPGVLIAVVVALPVTAVLFDVPVTQALVLAVKTICFMPFGPWIMGQFWTIPIEVGFYAVVCMILASGTARVAMGGLAWVLGAGSAGYWLAAAAGWIGPGGRFTELLLIQHGVFFALGMLCARLGAGTVAARHVGLAMVCLAGAALQIRTAASWEMAQRPDLAVYWPGAYALWIAFTACIALGFLWREAIAQRVGRWAPPLRLMGLSTYPLYLTHIHVGGAILATTAGSGIVPAFLCALGGALLAALTIAVWFEPPLHAAIDTVLRRIERKLGRLQQEPP